MGIKRAAGSGDAKSNCEGACENLVEKAARSFDCGSGNPQEKDILRFAFAQDDGMRKEVQGYRVAVALRATGDYALPWYSWSDLTPRVLLLSERSARSVACAAASVVMTGTRW